MVNDFADPAGYEQEYEAHYSDQSPKDRAQEALETCGIEENQIYHHHRGGLCIVVALSIKEDTLEPLVTYRSNKQRKCWTRTLANWNELDLINSDNLAPLETCGIEENQIYRHYKGGLYIVVTPSIKEDTLESLITYRSNKKKTCWTRTVTNWSELVLINSDTMSPLRIPRFARVEE